MARLDYVNARLRALRPSLLRDGDVRELLARPSTEARLELVARRARPGREGDRAPRTLEAAEALLVDELREDAARILSEVEGAPARRALAAALAVEDAAVVKAALRAVLSGGSVERALAAAPPSPVLPAATLRALALARTPEAVADALGEQAMGAALRAELARPKPWRLARLELAADTAAFESARAACRFGEDFAVVREHLALRIDARNAATLLVLTGGGAAPLAEGFLPGGSRLDAARFRVLATGPREAAWAAVAAAFPGVGAALGRPWTAERALAGAVLAALRRAARDRPLSVAVPLLYLAERRAAIQRLRVVLRGAERALPGDDLLALAEA